MQSSSVFEYCYMKISTTLIVHQGPARLFIFITAALFLYILHYRFTPAALVQSLGQTINVFSMMLGIFHATIFKYIMYGTNNNTLQVMCRLDNKIALQEQEILQHVAI